MKMILPILSLFLVLSTTARAELASQWLESGAKISGIIDLKIEKVAVGTRTPNNDELNACERKNEEEVRACASRAITVWNLRPVLTVQYESQQKTQVPELCGSTSCTAFASVPLRFADLSTEQVEKLKTLNQAGRRALAQNLFEVRQTTKSFVLAKRVGVDCEYDTDGFEKSCRSYAQVSEKTLVPVLVVDKKH